MSRCAILLALMLLATGCGFLQPQPKGKSLLAAIELGVESTALEVIFARLPTDDEELASGVWEKIDEQQLPAGLRRELAQNGFRAGIVGGQLPPGLMKLLELGDAKPTTAVEVAAKLETEPPIKRKQLQVYAGRRHELIASPLYDQLPVLMREEGQLRGKTYPQAQAFLGLKAHPQGEGGIRLEVAPELQYGQARSSYVGDEGVFRLESNRPRHVFEKLAMEVTLRRGQMLVLTHMPDRPGSLGHYFFTEPQSGSVQSKMMLLRLTDTKRDDLFQEPTEIAKAPATTAKK